jgi:hypothetical protein
MSDFPRGVETRADAIRFLGAIDGRNGLRLGAWDIDDFSSVSHHDPAIERCRLRARDELIPLLEARDHEATSALLSELIDELEANADN